MTTQLSPGDLGLPPPQLWLELSDAGRAVGWAASDVIGFRGFADEVEAAHAAWVAYRTLARRLARRNGARSIPIDTEPLTLRRFADQDAILASGREIGVLVRPGEESRSGPDSFGFEIRIPSPVGELRLRAKAHFVYRTLRKSGVRWAMWRPEPVPTPAVAAPAVVTHRSHGGYNR